MWCKEVDHFIVQEGEPCGAEPLRVSGEIHQPPANAPFELGGSVPAITAYLEYAIEIREAVDVDRGSCREFLEEPQPRGQIAKLALAEQLERAFRAPIVVAAGGNTLDRVSDQVEVDERATGGRSEVGGELHTGAFQDRDQLFQGERGRPVERAR